ncbi:hypothetical protein F5Y07DRAFT_161931 [Xylaria sp. FL0933]|nr:hypothetical protein F5Y07DRAFT_161931 [Xylaria sp. FL0933]
MLLRRRMQPSVWLTFRIMWEALLLAGQHRYRSHCAAANKTRAGWRNARISRDRAKWHTLLKNTRNSDTASRDRSPCSEWPNTRERERERRGE